MTAHQKIKEGVLDPGPSKYHPKSKLLSIVLHYGGAFTSHAANVEYTGGRCISLDCCNASKISASDFDSYLERVGVTGQRRYHLCMKDKSFKLFVDDADIRKWSTSFLTVREMHVYVEILEDESDEDDSDFKLGTDQSDNDDSLYDDLVDFDVECEYEAISTDNMYVEGQEQNVGAVEGQGSGLEKVGEVSEDGDSVFSMESEASEDDDDIFQEEVEYFADDFDYVNIGNIIEDDDQGINVEGEMEGVDTDSDSGEEDVVETGDNFDEGRLSDGEGGEKYPFFNPKTKYKPEFVLKQVFSTKKEFKHVVQSYAINIRRNIKFTKNDARRVYARCENSDCKWMLNALKMKNDTSFQIRKIIDKHNCAPSHKVKNLTSTWLSDRFLQRFQSDGGRSVKGFMADAIHDTRCEISKTQAYKAKGKVLAKIEGDPDAQYAKLWAYAEEVRKTNPGSTVILGTDVDNGVSVFSRYYCCFHALKQGFKAGCRKILGIDGCFLKSKHGGMLLTVVGVDGNNNPFPVAFAVVERENQETWEWFLSVIKSDLDIVCEDFTFMSDKQKGLIGAMETIFPGVDHRFCVRHLHNNLKVAGFRGMSYKLAMWKAVCSTTVGMFNEAMKELKEINVGAWEWFINKPPKQWSKAYFSEKAKCDMLLNNVYETFNANIREAREKSIITMLEWIRESLMVRLQRNRDRALAKWKGRICPKIQKIMDTNTEKVADCVAIKASDTHYQIRCFDDGQFTVDLKNLICSCRAWQLTGIPCTHSICALLRQKQDPIDFVDRFYHVETYNKSYEPPIFGMSYDVLWGDSMFIPPLPPNFWQRATRGRKAIKRRLEPFEETDKAKKGKGKLQQMKRQHLSYKCKKCGKEGHNTLTCGSTRKQPTVQPRRQTMSQPAMQEMRQPVYVEATSSTNILPPRPRANEEPQGDPNPSEVVQTQQSQSTSQPMVHGPSMHDQLLMGKKSFGS